MNEYGKRVAKEMNDYMDKPDSIDDEIRDIQKATHGVEVRGALAAGVKKSFTKSEKAENKSKDTEQRQDAVEQQFNTLLSEWSDDKPIDNAETIAARTNAKESKTYENLGKRLDEEYGKVTAQLAETVGVNVKDFGAVGDGVSDDTQAINDAIIFANSKNIPNVIIPSGVFLVDPGEYDDIPTGSRGGINLLDNINLFIYGVVKAKAVSAKGYNIIRAFRKNNISINGGVIKGEREEHIGTEGEWGHGINIKGCTNVTINTKVIDCWGDGLYVGGGGLNYPTRNLIISEFEADNNRRQGLSLTHVDGFKIGKLRLTNTNGTAPEAGIDIEPNAQEYVKNGSISTIESHNNVGYGVQFYAEREGSLIDNLNIGKIITSNSKDGIAIRESNVKNIEINNITSKNNSRNGVWIRSGVQNIDIDNIISEDNQERGVAVSGSSKINIGKIISRNNGTNGLDVVGQSNTVTIGSLIVEGGTSSMYGLFATNSSKVEIDFVKVTNSELSSIYIDLCNDLFINSISIFGAKSYPIRLSRTSKLKLGGGVIGGQRLPEPDTISLLRLENNSKNNQICNLIVDNIGVKARYAVQFVESSTDNFIGYCNFNDSYITAPFYGKEGNTVMYNVLDEIGI